MISKVKASYQGKNIIVTFPDHENPESTTRKEVVLKPTVEGNYVLVTPDSTHYLFEGYDWEVYKNGQKQNYDNPFDLYMEMPSITSMAEVRIGQILMFDKESLTF